jgi:2-(1,2-epoxy-1,2-dihydrophenyl)acetyl-CoA isomerase
LLWLETDPEERMAYEKIKISLNDGVAVITLADPATMNAAGLDTMAELRAAFAAYARPDSGARCVILTGEGRGFCSGVGRWLCSIRQS